MLYKVALVVGRDKENAFIMILLYLAANIINGQYTIPEEPWTKLYLMFSRSQIKSLAKHEKPQIPNHRATTMKPPIPRNGLASMAH